MSHRVVCAALVVAMLMCVQSVSADSGRSGFESPSPDKVFAPQPTRRSFTNVLLLGLDRGSDPTMPARTDTMILASVDTRTRHIVMVSIPRDLWVDIPGYGEGRINTAYYLGEYYALKGSGPALAMKTVAAALDVPVDYYVTVDFDGFVSAIDAIGGLDIDVPKDVRRYAYIDGQDSSVIAIPAGSQHMDGATTLTYVRSRFGTTDYERMRRQQQVLLAARSKVLGLQIPVGRYPALFSSLGGAIKTDLPVTKMFSLAAFAIQMDSKAITHVVIDESIAHTVIRPSGAMVEVPDWDKLHALVRNALPQETPAPLQSGVFSRFLWGW